MLDIAGPEQMLLPDRNEPERVSFLRAINGSERGSLPDLAYGLQQDANPDVAPEAPRINPTARELRFIVPLADGEIYLGDLELAVSPQDELAVDAVRLLELLKDRIEPGLIARLAASVDAKGRLNAAALERVGIKLAYDPERLALSVALPIEGRSRQAVTFRSNDGDSGEETLKPAKFSGYLNFYSSITHVQTGANAGFVAPNAQIDGALRLGGFVLEGEGYLSARKGDTAWRRSGTRLVYDDERQAMRWTFGDTQLQPRQFQAAPTVFGLGVSRLYALIDPQREIRASGAQSFSILSPSSIETFVNGRQVERRTLMPGNYTLRDFPIAQGSNAVRLRIEEAGGRVRTIDFSVYSNQSLLARGVTEFSAFAGVNAQPTASGINYSGDWMLSGFVRSGISEQFTLGVNLQANKEIQQVGAEGILGSRIGLFGFNLTTSRDAAHNLGYAAALNYELQLSGAGQSQTDSLRAAVEWRSARFVLPEVAFGPDRKVWSLTAGYVHNFKSGAYISLDGQVARNRLPFDTSYSGRLAAGVPLNDRLNLVPEIGYQRTGSRRELFARMGLSLRLGRAGDARFDFDSKGRARASISTSSGSGVGASQFSGEVSRDSGMMALTANAGLTTNRADLSVQQTAGYSESSRQIVDSQTTVRAAFSIAWADGAVAMGRPVNDAFLIAKAHRTLKGKRVALDPANDGDAARTDALGPALIGQLPAYVRRTIVYSVPDAPSGYDLGEGNVALRPKYKSGYQFTIGSDYNLLVLGRLLNGRGETVSLIAGKAIDLDNPDHPALTIFTSRDGKFGAQGLRVGRWKIEIPGDEPLNYVLNVTPGADGTSRVGDLRPVQGPTIERNER